MLSENCSLFAHGAQIAPYHKQKNISKVLHFFIQLKKKTKLPQNLPSFVSNAESLGPEYSEMLILDLDATWSESEPRTPLVCILSIGSDPTSQIATLAKNKSIRSYSSMIYYVFYTVKIPGD